MTDDTAQQLRVLAASDPRAARRLFLSLLDSGGEPLDVVLRLAAAPGEGRIRQLIANSLRGRRDRDVVVPHLIRWLEVETDEFARAAVAAALEGVDISQRRREPLAQPPRLVEAYRYVTERLCHRVRNGMSAPAAELRRIEALARDTEGPAGAEILAAAARLKDSLRVLSRLVEFDTGDDYLSWRSFSLAAWIPVAARNYCAKNEPIQVELKGADTVSGLTIRATEFLLETVFWNLWKNARQSVEGRCQIAITLRADSGRLFVLLSDNGRGFGDELIGVAFEEQFSTRGPGRGRGLLEVADAVQRLGGAVELVVTDDGSRRVCISVPLEAVP